MTKEYRQNRFLVPPGACEVILVRHGESEAARPGEKQELWEGRGDPDLAPTGREQAEQVTATLAGEDVAAVYVTALRRTHQTAAPLLARLGMEARVEPGLEEVSLGDWEGGEFRIRVAESDPLIGRMLAEEEWAVIPGAESVAAFTARTTVALSRIAATPTRPSSSWSTAASSARWPTRPAPAPSPSSTPTTARSPASSWRGDGWTVRSFNEVSRAS